MATLNDGVYVRATDDGFIEVQRVKHDWGVDVGSVLRFEGANARAIMDRALAVHAAESPHTSEVASGDDAVTLRIGGPEMAPVLNLINRRKDGSESAVALEWSTVPEVVAQVAALLG